MGRDDHLSALTRSSSRRLARLRRFRRGTTTNGDRFLQFVDLRILALATGHLDVGWWIVDRVVVDRRSRSRRRLLPNSS